MTIDLSAFVAVVLGGDGRECETLRLLQEHGARINAYGCPPCAERILGRAQAASVQEAARGAHIIICPIPYPAADGSLYAPEAPAPIYLNEETLGTAAAGAVLITGVATSAMKEAARTRGLRLHEYEDDDELMILRSAAIAEGAAAVAIQHSLVSIHQSRVLIVGFGRTGIALGHLLIGMRAHAFTATRSPVARARAYEIGLTAYPLEQLPEVIGDMQIIFNSAPAKVLTRDILGKLSRDAVLIDIAAPPGGVDREAARELDITFVWARGLGGVAPRTVAESQWIGIERILRAELPETSQRAPTV